MISAHERDAIAQTPSAHRASSTPEQKSQFGGLKSGLARPAYQGIRFGSLAIWPRIEVPATMAIANTANAVSRSRLTYDPMIHESVTRPPPNCGSGYQPPAAAAPQIRTRHLIGWHSKIGRGGLYVRFGSKADMCRRKNVMSALPPKADICSYGWMSALRYSGGHARNCLRKTEKAATQRSSKSISCFDQAPA